ncbi:MAG: 3-isopropylmalate dehydratase small subunit [Anaeromusa sp.]|mgnify:FL=1|uniref:3-isopropylmalate dehydratase small subunit n=1 Tax=Anaeromusa sp. TaxID=1872520 RepID=UPI002633A662|nr:3-isopropylmalate dehydratase small subunit [Anaeromusa sp.]MDD3157860.1 3-isopropylmalate dehydratase small subunit [Anaeromusa sp.]MEA4833838.1 3-isopropylmalate dehydratase small subunit [Anaeromusa sp.]NCB76335.1 3-isopropylmalate dehydratase small subunit [Negativicutes bacterium]
MNRGRVWKYGDHVDTDVIIPARYLSTSEPAELAKHCMEDIDDSFRNQVQAGDIMVAGRNFGCGSSREHAPAAIQACGISCVIAHSFARIFFRNAINIGLPLLEVGDMVEELRQGDKLKLHLDEGRIENLTTGVVIEAASLPAFVAEIAQAGGLIAYVREQAGRGVGR